MCRSHYKSKMLVTLTDVWYVIAACAVHANLLCRCIMCTQLYVSGKLHIFVMLLAGAPCVAHH